VFFQILDILHDSLPMIGIFGEYPTPIIWKNGLPNLKPDYVMTYSNPTKHGCLIPVSTYFWEKPDKHS